MELVTMEVCSCEPDSTVEDVVEEYMPQPSAQLQTAMELLNWHLVQNQNSCANMLANSLRERDRLRTELRKTLATREAVMADLTSALKVREIAARSVTDAKISLQEAVAKRCALLKQIEAEKMWRPPSVIMKQKKQRELRERVERMRALLNVQIVAPDDI